VIPLVTASEQGKAQTENLYELNRLYRIVVFQALSFIYHPPKYDNSSFISLLLIIIWIWEELTKVPWNGTA